MSYFRAFSTLGCSEFTLPQIAALARETSMNAVEWRGVAGELDLPARVERPDGTFDREAGLAFLKRIASDEVLASQVMLKQRRPAGVSKERFGVAVRAASREPMLAANPESIASGLDWKHADETVKKRSVAKGGIFKRIVVKPASLRTAKYGRNSA